MFSAAVQPKRHRSTGMTDNNHIISNIGKAFRNNHDNKIIDLDDKIGLSFTYQIHRIEQLVEEFKEYMPPNRMSHYYMALLTSGKGEKSIGQYTFTVQPNMAMVIPYRGIHSSRNWSKQNKGYMLSFNDKLFIDSNFPKAFLNSTPLFNYFQVPYRTISKEDSEKLAVIFENIIVEHNNYAPLKSEMICIKIAELIIQFDRIFTKDHHIQGLQLSGGIYERFIELLETNFINEKSVKFYADKLATHANNLNAVVKKQSGYSAKEIIRNRLLLEAKYLLASTLLSVKEIAIELGFEDQNYFSHFFKEHVKITPIEYRLNPI